MMMNQILGRENLLHTKGEGGEERNILQGSHLLMMILNVLMHASKGQTDIIYHYYVMGSEKRDDFVLFSDFYFSLEP